MSFNHICMNEDKRLSELDALILKQKEEIIQYENSIFIKAKIKPVCDPCYLLIKCPIKNYPCMSGILAKDVINKINNHCIL